MYDDEEFGAHPSTTSNVDMTQLSLAVPVIGRHSESDNSGDKDDFTTSTD